MDHNNNSTNNSSPKQKQQPASASPGLAGGGNGDRLKRDEWSEGAVSCLLEAYEAKWILRNRAKLKGHDWEDVAKHVSSRANTSKSPKTQTQCKNKIESMKKRYRSESATSDVSSWPLFHRLDLLLRGHSGVVTAASASAGCGDLSKVVDRPPAVTTAMMGAQSLSMQVVAPVPVTVVAPLNQAVGQNSVGSNGDDDPENKEDVPVTKVPDNQSEKMEIESDCSTPALYSSEKEKVASKNHKTKASNSRKRRRKGENWDIAESIRWLAKVMVKSEQAKAETMRELEKMRADAEIKRSEIDLKRTEIIAHTQLEIAKLFAASLGKGVDPSLHIGRS